MSTCRFAENGFYISPQQTVSPCCSIWSDVNWSSPFESVDQFFTNPKILDIRKASIENRILDHPACIVCQTKENQQSRSMRTRGDRLISSSSSNHIKRLDISFGNTCNLDCVMCRPDFSSKWNKVVETMPDDIKRGTEKKLVKNTTMTYDQIDTILDKVGKKLESIVIKGGEPLYDKKAQYFLNKLSDINPNVELSITSNCTIINQEFLSKFKRLYITASVDGIFEIYEYIRGTNFSTITSNLQKLSQMDNVNVQIAFTASVFNFLILPQSINYWKNIGIENFQVDYAQEKYLSPFLLGKKNYIKIAQSNPYTEGWKFKKPLKEHYELHENYKQFWNKHRGMDWDNIDVSKY